MYDTNTDTDDVETATIDLPERPLDPTEVSAAFATALEEPLRATVDVSPEALALARDLGDRWDEPADTILINYAELELVVEERDPE
jgi:hypothetical protein